MDPTSEARNIAKEQYTNVRRSLADFEERVIASRWDEDTLVRTGFDRFLGSLDRIADWIFAEGDQPKDEGTKDEANDEAGEPGTAEQPQAEERDKSDQPRAEEPGTTAQTQVDEPGTAEPAQPGMGEQTQADTVDVVFTFPADVEATTVALCGEFNDWSEDDIYLSRDADGTWRTTVALEPGRSYRYRFLLDGERWENARQADEYVPNPFGTVDSVVIVGQRAEN
jgi:hypothetical protein